MISWVKNNRLEAIFILTLLLISAFLRFYRLPEYMMFLGDEGRDALMIQRILVEHDFPLLGPPTSVGNIYLGPLYYYMMAIPMAIWWLNPVAATGMVALIGVATVGLIYYLARNWFGVVPAILSATLYTISPVNIIYSRSSWNPNPAPFFALLAIAGLYRARQSNNFYWWILTSMALAAAVQMHYLALLLVPIFGLFWLFEYLHRAHYQNFLLGTILGVVAFLLFMSPLAIFDFKYNFLNSRAMISMFSGNSTTLSFSILDKISKLVDIYQSKLISRYLTGGQVVLSWLISLLVLIPLFLIIKKRAVQKFWPFWALGIWLTIGLLGLSFYKGEIYDHYLGFLNPVPYLLIGSVSSFLNRKKQVIFLVLLLVPLGFINIQKNPLLTPPSNQLQRTKDVAHFIIEESDGKPFNFALLASQNYDAAYQFYLDAYGHKPKTLPLEKADQLFVVCEDVVCNPVGHAKYEIAAWGWAKIDKVSEAYGVKIYKLVANPNGKPL